MNGMGLKKILIVEDSENYQQKYINALRGKVDILSAYSLGEGEHLFEENPDVTLIVMDACVPGDSPNATALVTVIRRSFAGPMIAASSLPKYRKILMAAGCDYEEDKDFVVAKVIELLGII